jgi:hypothetical protein
MIPKFKAEHDEVLWDCLFDINLTKYYTCFDKVRRKFYNQMPDGDNDVIRQIANDIMSQTSNQFKSQKPEYNEDVHS